MSAVRTGALPPVPPEVETPAVEIAHPANPEHGDLASNLAMKLARPLRRPPLATAEVLATILRAEAGGRGSRRGTWSRAPWRTP